MKLDAEVLQLRDREKDLMAQLRQEREARFVRCLWHEGCTLEAGHEKCGECGKGKGGACGACHCEHTLHVDLRIADRKLEAARNRIEDDSQTADNLCKSIGVTETVNERLQAQVAQLQTTISQLSAAIREFRMWHSPHIECNGCRLCENLDAALVPRPAGEAKP